MAISRGVLVDANGFFLGAFQWDDAQGQPDFSVKPRAGQTAVGIEDARRLLTDERALDPPSTKARWDAKAKTWHMPDVEFWIVDAKGVQVGGGKCFASRKPIAKPGQEVVYVAPPKVRSKRMIWDGEQWLLPENVALIDETGAIRNIVVQNPRADQPNVTPRKGWKAVRERDLPATAKGQRPKKGDKLA